MTSEICMMNRLAVVLAADSATTVSRWVDGKKEERYFKGANKIFQLSDAHPVGLMIFDSADVLNVPWEVIIKAFRSKLGKKSFNTVKEYAVELFEYLASEPQFFPEEMQNDAFLRASNGVLAGWIISAIDEIDHDQRVAAVETYFQGRIGETVAKKVVDCIGQDLAQKLTADFGEQIEATAKAFMDGIEVSYPGNLHDAVSAAIREALSAPESYFDTTGLVFAGFGDHEIFPAMVEYVSCGLIGGRPIFVWKSETPIDHKTPAWLSAFAQTSMTDTFSLGLSFDVYSSLMLAVSENLATFAEDVASKSGGDFSAIHDVDSLVQGAKDKISKAVLDKAKREHSLPMKSVLRFLPVDEMAGLAETLITLQSLKEKVTKPSETVGGPVDVAIITKHEGLVWIKRKHFFNLDINSRYALRQAALHT